jgi:deoxyguanosine kinase
MPVVSIDGNIGAGKSTVLNYLKNNYHYQIDLEPIDDWLPFLQDMYKNSKDAFEFQIKVWFDRTFNVQYPLNKNILTERSGFFHWEVFSKANFKIGKLNERQYTILKDLYEKRCFDSDIYIYIRTDPKKSFDRINTRNRNCESDINIKYIELLHNLHENAYQKLLDEEIINNVHIIEMENKSVQDIAKEIHDIISKYGVFK